MIETGEVNSSNAIDVTRFVFRLYMAKKLTDNDYSFLTNLPLLLADNSLNIPAMCLLPDFYQGEFQFQAFLPNGTYISQNYPESEDQILLWKTFFKRLGVRDRFTISAYRNPLKRSQILNLVPNAGPYLISLDNAGVYPSNTAPYKNAQHTIEGFYWPEFFEHASTYSFSKIFWKHLFEQWELIKEMEARATYKTMISSQSISSYFKFYLQSVPCIPGSDLQCHVTGQLYSASLKVILGGTKPYADFGFDLSVEQERWLKLKDTLTVDDCINLLIAMSVSQLTEDSQKQLMAIYRQLIAYSKQNENVDILKSQDKSKILAAAYNDSFQPLDKLYGFGVSNTNPPAGSKWFLKAGTLKADEYEKLCKILGLKIIDDVSLECMKVNERLDSAIALLLQNRCKYLAVLTSKLHARYFQIEYENLYELIRKMTFRTVESLELQSVHGKTAIIYQQKISAWRSPGCFYYTKKWNSPTTWISLKYRLAEWLGLQGNEDWLDVILLEDEPGIVEWLTDHGYNIPQVSEPIYVNSPEVDYNSKGYITTEQIDQSFEDRNVKADNEDQSFVPRDLTQIDLSSVSVTRHSVRINEGNTIVGSTIQNEQTRSDIGRWGEELVYRKKIEELSRKYKSYSFRESEGSALWKKGEKIVQLTWLNCITEQSKPYDIFLQEENLSYIEVKSTPSPQKTVFYISGSEWQFMMEKGTAYSIYRVFNAGTAMPGILEIPNPSLKIVNGDLMPVRIELSI